MSTNQDEDDWRERKVVPRNLEWRIRESNEAVGCCYVVFVSDFVFSTEECETLKKNVELLEQAIDLMTEM